MRCGNTPCPNEATCFYITDGGLGCHFFLCSLCGEAFQLGQVNEGAVLQDVNTGMAVMEEEEDLILDDEYDDEYDDE